MRWGVTSQLPRQVSLQQQAVPITTAAAVSGCTVLTDLERISVTNTTASTITLTVTDGNDAPIANLNATAIDPAIPASFEFHPPVRCTGGIKWVASATGLKADVSGWRLTGWTAGTGSFAGSTAS